LYTSCVLWVAPLCAFFNIFYLSKIKAMTILLEPVLPWHDLKALLLESALGVGGLEIQPQ